MDEIAHLVHAMNRFPRMALGEFPSPVKRQMLADDRFFWVKDDGGCSKVYGGNKVRKLEFLLAEARQNGKRRLVVHGDVESHTVQAGGRLGRTAGFEVHAVVFPYRGQSFQSRELELLCTQGIRVHKQRSMVAAVLHAHWLGWRLNAQVIPLGASTPVATLGHVEAALELLEQVRQKLLPEPQRIYIPFATGSSVAGLLIGLGLAKARTQVVAVQTVESIIANRQRLRRLVKNTLRLLGFDTHNYERCLGKLELIERRYLGNGYRDVPPVTKSAVELAARHQLRLEPAFSGKAFCAMLDALPDFPNGELLFWNTHDRHDVANEGRGA